jgi:general secretion pathway protein G
MNTQRRARSSRLVRSGFTLIEVMIVIAIILALTGLVGVALFKRRDEAKRGIVETQMHQIEAGLKSFRLKFDRYPTDDEGVEVLWNKEKLSQEASQDSWSKFLEKPLPNDGWNHPWGYRQQSQHGDEDTYDLWSNGPDGEEGTSDDITSWPPEDTGAGAGSSPSGGNSSPSRTSSPK